MPAAVLVFLLLSAWPSQADARSGSVGECQAGAAAAAQAPALLQVVRNSEKTVQIVEDDGASTGSGSGSQSIGQCPVDVSAAAEEGWSNYFEQACLVQWEDVPVSIKTAMTNAMAVPSRRSRCRIVVPYGDAGEVGGDLIFEVKEVAGMEENWAVVDGSEVYASNAPATTGQLQGEHLCNHLLGVGVPRIAYLPPVRVDEVFSQVQEDFEAACSSKGFERHQLALHEERGIHTRLAKRTMTEVYGATGYVLWLEVAVPGLAETESLRVVVAEDALSEAEAADAANLDFETAMEQQTEQAYLMNSTATGSPPSFLSLQNQTERYEALKARLRTVVSDIAAEAAAAAGLPGPLGRPSPTGHPQVVPPQIAPIGPLRVLDDRTLPELCCLCGSCSNMAVCDEGPDGLGGSGNASNSSGGGSGNNSLLQSFIVPPELGRLRTPLPALGSPEAERPPPRPVVPGGNRPSQRPRRRAAPWHGDNFQSVVLPQRSAEDHARIWAQSRALVRSVERDGLEVPEEYHFYDHDERARCWQPAYNQGECGSCWAFASLGALEKQICMRAKGTYVPSLSREMLVRCSEQNNACAGGNANTAYEDLMEIGGVWSTDCLPYQGDGSKHCPAFEYSWFGQGSKGKTGKLARIDQEIMESCNDLTRYTNRPPMGSEWDMPFEMMYEARFSTMPNTSDPRLERFRRYFAKSRARDRVPSWFLYGEPAMKAAIVKYGSIYASYIAMDDFKGRSCNTGCWPPGTVWGEEAEFRPSDCGCPNNGHAVHIVGYGTDIQESGVRVPYWLIENSWGGSIHGDVTGEDSGGVKKFGKDPFTELHPMGVEDKCVLGGWVASTLPRTGGCGGNANVNIRPDIPITGGPPDGFELAVDIDGHVVFTKSVQKDSFSVFNATVALEPGNHTVKFFVNAKNHPKQQALELEQYKLFATSIRCRGRGFAYSFTKNDTKASVSFGRMTRRELRQAQNELFIANGINPENRFDQCPSACRTGSYSEVLPCEGMLVTWGSCYTDEWVRNHEWYQQYKVADCDECVTTKLAQYENAMAVQGLPNATFYEWYELAQQAFTAPDDPGWMRQFLGSCELTSSGHNMNTVMTATYQFTVPTGADGAGGCDERHSAPYARGRFVHAPGLMQSGDRVAQRCPPPLAGQVQLKCEGGVLTALSHTCHERASATELSPEVQARKVACGQLAYADCEEEGCAWDQEAGACGLAKRGYFKIVRGINYHGIEEGAAFAIAEMSRFVGLCPTTGWTRWSECSAVEPCERGSQNRTRQPANGLAQDSPACAEISFNETRPCVGPGFCPEVLTRFVQGSHNVIEDAMRAYTSQSRKLPYSTAGAHMMASAYPSCADAKHWCNLLTGGQTCSMMFEGHFEVKADAEYFLRYEASEGDGELAFNTLGVGEEGKPEYLIRAGGGNAGGSMHVWQDLGFHHRRRRTGLKPWTPISSINLRRGTYFAQMTRSSWSSCPSFALVLERTKATFGAPLLVGVAGVTGISADVLGNTAQQHRTWRNDWGAISSSYMYYRGRYTGYAPLNEQGLANELVLRDRPGATIIGRSGINKTSFSADELYSLLGMDKANPPDSIREYQYYELVLRTTVILPERGEYKVRYQQDTTADSSNTGWRFSSRRRQQWVVVRVNGSSQSQRSINTWAGSTELEVSHVSTAPGEVTVEASIQLMFDGVGNKVALPNFMLLEMKQLDTLHSGPAGSLEFGSRVSFMSEMEAIRGDTEVRIDWPDRDDPLSSELRAATFQPVHPGVVLIGKRDLLGFAAEAEGRIDAGACLSLQALTADGSAAGFQGFVLDLCDLDGKNQYLELSALHGNNASSATRTQVGWVHIGFTQPTHLRIIRTPGTLSGFEVSYRPDDRIDFASPFCSDALGGAAAGFTGPMDVGVSIASPEAYRYAEFYNVSVEACPSSCEEAGEQALCGAVPNACGGNLTCPGLCSGGKVCHQYECITCPELVLTPEIQTWQCGSVQHVCTNRKGRRVRVDRPVGMPAPSVNHYCSNHNWVCQGKSKWSFLAEEGMECGSVTDVCGTLVQLWDCPRAGDLCVEHKCVCSPLTFGQHFECGWAGDGCGRNVTFGAHDGHCARAGDRCVEHVCCTPKTLADFNSSYQCGAAPDGCGGHVYFTLPGQGAKPYFKQPPSQTTGSTFSGELGIEFKANADFMITSLGRGLKESTSALQSETTVTLWAKSGQQKLASVVVGPSSSVVGGYASEPLANGVPITRSTYYRVTASVLMGSNDSYPTAYQSPVSNTYEPEFAEFRGQVVSNVVGTYPNTGPSANRAFGMVNFGIRLNDGCGPFPWACANHSCYEREITGFTVSSGQCPLTNDGQCVSSPNYPSNYADNEQCTITPPPETPLRMVEFHTEGGFDWLTINGQRYSGRRRTAPPTTFTLTQDITWTSDWCCIRKGWKMCTASSMSLLAAEEVEEADDEDTPKPMEPVSPDLTLKDPPFLADTEQQ